MNDKKSDSPAGSEWLTVTNRLRIPTSEFEFTFARSSGPGGQNVNKVNTKAQLRWNVAESPNLPADVRERLIEQNKRRVTKGGELIVSSQRYRDQSRNAADCLEKLQAMLVAAARRPKARKKTKPSRAAKEKRLREKRERSEKKQRRRSSRIE